MACKDTLEILLSTKRALNLNRHALENAIVMIPIVLVACAIQQDYVLQHTQLGIKLISIFLQRRYRRSFSLRLWINLVTFLCLDRGRLSFEITKAYVAAHSI